MLARLYRDVARICSNITLANSRWSARQHAEHYGAPVHGILYPPNLGDVRDLTAPRKLDFLSIGRIHSSKRWPEIVKMVEGVRARGHQVSLTLAGSGPNCGLLEEIKLLRQIRKWLTLEINLPREKLGRLIAMHRFGLHGMVDEHYGMAVAELVYGGCLTLVHDSGGQVEIVRQPEARYRDVGDAVGKICALLEDDSLRDRIDQEQASHRRNLTCERFLQRLHALLDDFEAATLNHQRALARER